MYFENINHLVVNSFRRMLLSRIPNYAFDEINININSSVIDDDQLSHRFSMIPIECFENLEIHFKIKNNTMENLEITTNHFETHAVEINEKKYNIFKNILICILRPKQEIDLNLKTNNSTGKENAKYSHIYNVSYEQEIGIYCNDILLKKDDFFELNNDEIKIIKERIPYLLNEKNTLINKKLYLDTNILQNLNQLLNKKFQRKTFSNFHLNFENYFNHSKKEIFNKGIDLICNDISNLKIKENKMYCDYTISNLIKYYYEKKNNKLISIFKSHPLDDFMNINLDCSFEEVKDYIINELKTFKYL